VFERKGFLKVILNLLVLAEEVLAYGGGISIKSLPNDGGITMEIAGRNAQINPTIALALKGETVIEELTPRTIQAYITGRFTEFFGFTIDYDQSVPDRLIVSLRVSNRVVVSPAIS
jgi:histidine phosphotransferase ChpT